MSVAIIIPSIGVDPLLRRCVAECRRRSPDAEILVYVDDATGRESIESMCSVFETGAVTIATKRNLGARATTAPYLAFIDSDAYPAEGWIENALRLFEEHPEYAVVGGPNASPPDEPRSQRLVGLALHSFLVGGWWAYRKDPHAHAREVSLLPTCNMLVRAEDYAAMEGMHEGLFTGEDTDFCRRVRDSGRQIYFSPDVLVFHKNRDVRNFAVQRFTFGVALVPLLEKGAAPEGAYLTVSVLIALFVVMVLAGPLGLVWSWWGWTWLAMMLAYTTLLFVEAVRHARKASDVAGAMMTIAIGNLAPGLGVVLKALRLVPDLRGIYRNDR